MNKKVTWVQHANSLNEIYQPSNMQFSFANIIDGKIYQCHQWVKCKDYLHDVIKTCLTGIDSIIYGFEFLSTDIKTDLNNIRLLVAQPELVNMKWFELRRTFTRSLKYIHYFENIVNEGFSKIEKVSGDIKYNHVWMFTGPKFWLTTPYFVSLYTFLIRLGVQENNNKKKQEDIFSIIKWNKVHDADNYNLLLIKQHLKKIILNRYKLEDYKDGFSESYYLNINTSSFHNRMGIVSLCNANTPFLTLNTNFNTYINTEEDE